MPSIVLWAPDHWTASSAEQEQEWGAASQASALQNHGDPCPGAWKGYGRDHQMRKNSQIILGINKDTF